MHYLKRNTKYSILAFLVLILSITISLSTLAKTKVHFFLNELGEFKEPKDLLQFTEITNLEWEEWKEEGIRITVN